MQRYNNDCLKGGICREAMLIYCCLFCLVLFSLTVKAADNLRISIITCQPGDELYTLFGHTALRVQETDSLGNTYSDVMFNYGAFDYNADKFVYRFLKGETDYVLAAEPSEHFLLRYAEDRCWVSEQELNLTDEEKTRLFGILKENILPENRTYRYNWLYYNCTNRAKEVVEAAVDGRIEYRKAFGGTTTAREILHRYTSGHPWKKFGIDFILGEEIDRELTHDQQMFIPEIYKDEINHAVIVGSDGNERPLVKAERYAVEPDATRQAQTSESSKMVFLAVWIVILALVAFIIYKEIKRRRTYKWIDVAICAIVGLVGILITFFFFCSEHPGMSTNWLVIIFNPIPLAFIPFIIRRKTKYVCMLALLGYVAGLITMRCMHQDSTTWGFCLLASILLLRILVNSHLNGKNKKII